jgi:hypothetical protein
MVRTEKVAEIEENGGSVVMKIDFFFFLISKQKW